MKISPGKILVAVPAYNCENQIARVINQINIRAQELIDTVVIIDNRSTDRTLTNAIEFGKKNFEKCNFLVLRNAKNFGLGGSHKVAFNYAIKHKFDYVVIMHGDDQGKFDDLYLIIKKNRHVKSDCILGSRFMTGSRLQGYSLFRTFGNVAYNKIFSFASNFNIKDLGSGLNLYKVKSLQNKFFIRFPDDLTFNYVMILASIFLNQKIIFFPISWREDDQISNVRLFNQALKVLAILLYFTMNKYNFMNLDFRSFKFNLYDSKIMYRKILDA